MMQLTTQPKLLLLVVLAVGCTTTQTGTGFGSAVSGGNPVTINWTSSDSVSGSMSATLADGATYTGHYLQVTSTAKADGFGFGPGPWGNGMANATLRSGQVLANLTGPDGSHMRCLFQLAHPDSGMSGGGGGLCQTPNGNTIDVTLSRA